MKWESLTEKLTRMKLKYSLDKNNIEHDYFMKNNKQIPRKALYDFDKGFQII